MRLLVFFAFFLLVLAILFIIIFQEGVKYREFRDNAPCAEFKNDPARSIPARCIEYFGGTK